jgi:hypothetical protein
MENSPDHSNHSDSNRSHHTDPSTPRTDDDMGLLRAKYKQSNNKVYHDFYKTKMCSLFNLNICKKGNDCPFAHSVDELRDKPNLFRTQLCEAFLQGQCDKGDDCTFAHGETDLRSTPDLFKTAMCHLWSQGKCTNGDSCRFAHGYDDLRPAPSHQKFKKKGPSKPQKQPHSGYDQNFYYNNQYSYPANAYGYQMYPMPMMMPNNMQGNYMMNQPFGYHGGMNPSIQK